LDARELLLYANIGMVLRLGFQQICGCLKIFSVLAPLEPDIRDETGEGK